MAKYRKKPVVVEATQWFNNGDHPEDYIRDCSDADRKANNWEGDVVRYYRHPEVKSQQVCVHCGNTMHEHGWIDTFEGGHIVCPGDWIITGIKGERYPCKDDIFKATYDPVSGGSE